VELSWLDLRLSHLRQRDREAEKELLESIRLQGIKEPLFVVAGEKPHRYILLDGFKRYRCARQLETNIVGAFIAEGDEQAGILTLLRQSRDTELTELEYGALIDRLHEQHDMSVRQIASHLGCSPAWVSLRLGMVSQMSPLVRNKVLGGHFPWRGYLYGIRPFTRVNSGIADLVDRFVAAASNRDLSTRDALLLSRIYFKGDRHIRERIESGASQQVLDAVKGEWKGECDSDSMDVLTALADAECAMTRLACRLVPSKVNGDIALLRAHIVADRILRTMWSFIKALRGFHEQTGNTLSRHGAVGPGPAQESHSQVAGSECQDRPADHCDGWHATTDDNAVQAATAT
jgi:ParB/RepB/Spo0J family partition protein